MICTAWMARGVGRSSLTGRTRWLLGAGTLTATQTRPMGGHLQMPTTNCPVAHRQQSSTKGQFASKTSTLPDVTTSARGSIGEGHFVGSPRYSELPTLSSVFLPWPMSLMRTR